MEFLIRHPRLQNAQATCSAVMTGQARESPVAILGLAVVACTTAAIMRVIVVSQPVREPVVLVVSL